MSAAVFVDTNVLVYSRDASEPRKQERAAEWLARIWAARCGRTSVQVLHEYFVNVTEKLRPGLDREAARDDVRSLLAWRPVVGDFRVIEAAWQIQDRYRTSWWDALIIAAAQLADCRFLLTEDLQDGQQLGSLVVVDPFRHAPADLSL